MESMSITEALAEVKLIAKRIEKKKETIFNNLVRQEHVADPFQSAGGTPKFIKEETQAIGDLWDRLIRIREAIGKANLENEVTVEGQTRTIAGWLAWRREVQEQAQSFYGAIKDRTNNALQMAARNHQLYKPTEAAEPILVKTVSNVDLAKVTKAWEVAHAIEDRLDGQLSLKNAQIQVSF